MTSHRRKILYIVGWGRSGSTILARILAQFDGFTHLGELRTLWVDGFKQNNRCGCGQLLQQCDTWQNILNQAFEDIFKIDAKAMTALRRKFEPHSQDLFKLILANQKKDFIQKSAPYLSVLETLYQTIQDVSKSAVIVDDSLHPGYAYMLSCLTNVDLYLIHIVRDPRGSAYSWSSRRKKGLGTYAVRDTALGWNLRNIVSELLALDPDIAYKRIKYETFAQSPKSTLQSVLDFIKEAPASSPFISPGEVKLEVTHSVFGNPDRLQGGTTKIQLDQAWRQQMNTQEKRQVTLLTLPMLLRYGYRP